LGEKASDEGQQATHGICSDCRDFLERNRPGSLRDFLNRLSRPVLCVDFDVKVVAANDAACAILGQDPCRVEGSLLGDLTECRWARLPGGCGRQEHCLACAIRRSVDRTYRTGEQVFREKAWIDVRTPDRPAGRKRMCVSTAKRNDLVFLRIDEIGWE
jgi:PAS domain-containing protein